MASLRTTVKSVRIANEVAEYFENKPLNRMVEGLCDLLERGMVTYDGENLTVANTRVPEAPREPKTGNRWNIDEADLMDLDSMSRFMGGDVRTMIHLFDEAVNEGVIRYDQGRYVGVEDVELEDLYEICREQNVNPQEVIDKAVKAMRQNGKKPRG